MATKQVAQKRKRSLASQPPRRVSRACDRCRSRKYKCDGSHPCTTCSDAEQPCIYGSNFRKRGLVEGYVRGLERLLGLAVSSDPGFEPLVTSVMNNHLDSNKPIKTPMGGWTIGHEGETMLESWKRSSIPQVIRELIPALESLDANGCWRKPTQNFHDESMTERAVEKSNESSGPVLGSPGMDVATDIEVEALHRDDIDQGTHESGDAREVQDTAIEAALPEPSAEDQAPQDPGGRLRRDSSEQFQKELRSNVRGSTRADIKSPLPSLTVPQALPVGATELLDSYFRFSHCWFPIFERHTVQRLFYQYGKRCQTIFATSEGSGEIAALWAILAYEATFQSWETSRDGLTPSCRPSSCTSNAYDVARSLVPSEEAPSELGHVQALLLLALCNTRRARWRHAWLLVGQAIRIALDMGLNKLEGECSSSRNLHVFLGCFSLDTILSARLERVPFLRGDSLRQLLEEDGMDEWEPWRAPTHNRSGPCFIISTFNLTIKVMRILNDFLCRTATGSEAEEPLGNYQARLSAITDESQEGHTTGEPECPMPHQALLSLTIASVSSLIQSQTWGKGCARLDLPNTRLTSHLAQCRKAFGPQRLPPLAEYLGNIVLDCLNALPSTPNVLEARKTLYYFAFDGSGAAFSQLLERLQAQRNMLQDEPEPRLNCISREVEQIRRSPTSGLDMVITGNFAFSAQNFNLSGESNEPNTGLHAQTKNGTLTAAKHNAPLERPDVRSPGAMPSIYNIDSANKALSVEPAVASGSPAIELPLQADDDITLSDGDTVFDSLAFLDTTQWSVNWGDQLAEFGFADSTAFKEFCNDNERVTDQ